MSQAGRILLAVAVLVPIGIPLGMPFPLGIEALRERAQELIPWAWGINGCASVLSAILAALLAMHVGFTGVVAIATALYLVAPALLAGWWDRHDRQTSQGLVPDRS